jgi:hypothetical protein
VKAPITCRDKVRQRINNVVQNKGHFVPKYNFYKDIPVKFEYEKHIQIWLKIQSKLLTPSTVNQAFLYRYAIETYALHGVSYQTVVEVANEDGWALCDDPRSMIKECIWGLDLCVQMQLQILPMWMWGYDRDHYEYVLQALAIWRVYKYCLGQGQVWTYRGYHCFIRPWFRSLKSLKQHDLLCNNASIVLVLKFENLNQNLYELNIYTISATDRSPINMFRILRLVSTYIKRSTPSTIKYSVDFYPR